MKNNPSPSPNSRASERRLSGGSDDRQGRLPQPDFLDVQRSSEPSRSRSRSHGRQSDVDVAGVDGGMDVTVDQPEPEKGYKQQRTADDASIMDVDQ